MCWLVLGLALLGLVQPVLAGEISREYTEERQIGEDESYEQAYQAVCLRLQRRFAEEISGSVVQSYSNMQIDDSVQHFTERLQAATLARIRLEVLEPEEIRRVFRRTGGLMRVRARLSIDKEELVHFRKLLEERLQEMPLPAPAPAAVPDYWATRVLSPPQTKHREDSDYTLAISVYGWPVANASLPRPAFSVMVASEWDEPWVGGELNTLILSSVGPTERDPQPRPAEATKFSPPTLLSLNAVVHILPINLSHLRITMGVGGGIATIIRTGTSPDGYPIDYDHNGGQLLGQTTIGLRFGPVGLNIRAIWLRTLFERESGYRLVDRHLGSGIHFMAGLSWLDDRKWK